MVGNRARGGRAAGMRAALLLLVCLAALSLWWGAAPHAGAAERPPGGNLSDPLVREAAIAAPAVVRLATLHTATLTLTLCGRTITLPSRGNPYTVGALGSGAFISGQGDVLTAAHLVTISQADLEAEVFQSSRAASDIADALNTYGACLLRLTVTPEDVAAGVVPRLNIAYSAKVSPPRYLVWRSTSFTGTVSSSAVPSDPLLDGLLAAPHQEARLLASSEFDKNDLAVLSTGYTDTPSIALGDSSALAVQDRLAVLGFPGNGDVNADPTNLLTPSVNPVTVSAVKRSNGADLIQVGGNVEHGDSGGPAVDTNGRLVGVVSFGGPDTRGLTAFLRASNTATALLRQAGVTPGAGAFQSAWRAAFLEYGATTPGHWRRASVLLDALAQRYPQFGGVRPFKQYADAAAVGEAPLVPVEATPPWQPLAGAGALAVALVLSAVLLLRRRRRRRQPVSFPQPVPAFVTQGPGGEPMPSSQVGWYEPRTLSPSGPQYPPQVGPYAAAPYGGGAYSSGAYGSGAYGQPQPGYSPQPTGATPAPQLSATPFPGEASGRGPEYARTMGGSLASGRAAWSEEAAWGGAQHDASAAAQGTTALCQYGHPLPPDAERCPYCGAPRA